MSEPRIDIRISHDSDRRVVIVSVDINGSPSFDGSGITVEAALLETLANVAAVYAQTR